MTLRWPRFVIAALDVVNRRGKSVGVRLVRYSGKSRHAIHPKHLVDVPGHDWYRDHLRPGDTVLDVGCNNGAHAVTAAERAKRVIGMDYDVGQLRVAAATARERGLHNVQLLAWDITGRFPFPDGYFDAMLFLDVIEHIHPRVQALGEIARVLRPEGRLLVLSLGAYRRLSRWKHEAARRCPAESTGFRVVARKMDRP